MKVALAEERAVILIGDSKDIGEYVGENTVDAIVCDPPAGVAFMGKSWDKDRGGRDAWSAWLAELLAPSFRALKPGGHALFWALPRTSHWTARAVEDAGFEVRDVINWVYGSGFPKSLDVSKAIDARLGASARRPVIGTSTNGVGNTPSSIHYEEGFAASREKTFAVTSAATAAAAWSGWGTALKPACEHWILARKPIESTVAANVLKYGTGALNIDASRIGDERRKNPERPAAGGFYNVGTQNDERDVTVRTCTGRWPANFVLSHHPDCTATGEATDEHVIRIGDKLGDDSRELQFGMGRQATTTTTTTTTTYDCHEECPVRMLDEQTGTLFSHGGDVVAGKLGFKRGSIGSGRVVKKEFGGASRFFYCAKPPKSVTEAGLDHLLAKTGGDATDREDGSAGLNSPRAGAGRGGGAKNHHPTKKPVGLMRYLIKLITPPGGVVLDPFAGSGTTGVAALAEGFRFVGCELGGDVDPATGEGEYVPIQLGRIRHALTST